MARPEYRWELPEAIRARLGDDSYGAQRVIDESGHTLLVLHEPPKPDAPDREHAVFLRSPDGHWAYHGHPGGEHALASLLDRYEVAIDASDALYDEADTADALFTVIERVRPLARAAANLMAALQKARELARHDKALITARDQAYDLSRRADLLLADAQMALNFHLARQSEAQTHAAEESQRAQNKLNLLAAFTFPTMALATIFGMNLHSGLEDLHPVGFWLVFLGGCLLGLAVGAWVRSPGKAGPPSSVKTKGASASRANDRGAGKK